MSSSSSIQNTVAIMVIAVNAIVIVAMFIHAVVCFVILARWRARMRRDAKDLEVPLRGTLAYRVYEQYVNPTKQIGRVPLLLMGLITTVSSTMVISAVTILICSAIVSVVRGLQGAPSGAAAPAAASPVGSVVASAKQAASSAQQAASNIFKETVASKIPGMARMARIKSPIPVKRGGGFGFPLPLPSFLGFGNDGAGAAKSTKEETLADRILEQLLEPPGIAMLTTCVVLVWIVSIQKFADDRRLRANCEAAMKASRDRLVDYGTLVAESYENASLAETVVAALRTNDHNTVREAIAAAAKDGRDDADVSHAVVLYAVYQTYAAPGGASLLTETNRLSPVDRGVAPARHFADFPLNMNYAERRIPTPTSPPAHVVEFLSPAAVRLVEKRLGMIERARAAVAEAFDAMMDEHLTMFATLGKWSVASATVPAILAAGVRLFFANS